MRPSEHPTSTTRVVSATPTDSRNSVLRRSTASTTARIASTRATTGMIHLSLTIRLNSPENFETCCFETTVKLSPWSHRLDRVEQRHAVRRWRQRSGC